VIYRFSIDDLGSVRGSVVDLQSDLQDLRFSLEASCMWLVNHKQSRWRGLGFNLISLGLHRIQPQDPSCKRQDTGVSCLFLSDDLDLNNLWYRLHDIILTPSSPAIYSYPNRKSIYLYLSLTIIENINKSSPEPENKLKNAIRKLNSNQNK